MAATTKTYKAKFWRGNPQIQPAGGYECTRLIEAKTIAQARKLAREYEDGCLYGSMSLLSVELVK